VDVGGIFWEVGGDLICVTFNGGFVMFQGCWSGAAAVTAAMEVTVVSLSDDVIRVACRY
jgi:hypothetical protein